MARKLQHSAESVVKKIKSKLAQVRGENESHSKFLTIYNIYGLADAMLKSDESSFIKPVEELVLSRFHTDLIHCFGSSQEFSKLITFLMSWENHLNIDKLKSCMKKVYEAATSKSLVAAFISF